MASTGLIESQFEAIVASGALDDLRALASRRGDSRGPAVVFVRPGRGTDDDVVDVDYSQRVLFERVGGSRGSLLVVRLAGTGHANPIQQPQAYDAAVATKIVPFVDRLAERDTRPVRASER